MPPIELPTRTTGPPSTSWTKRLSSAALWLTLVSRPSAGVRPNPGRSSATTRRRSASAGAMPTQLRCDPPSPWTRTTGGSSRPASGGVSGPPKSTHWTGPSRSAVRLTPPHGEARSGGVEDGGVVMTAGYRRSPVLRCDGRRLPSNRKSSSSLVTRLVNPTNCSFDWRVTAGHWCCAAAVEAAAAARDRRWRDCGALSLRSAARSHAAADSGHRPRRPSSSARTTWRAW